MKKFNFDASLYFSRFASTQSLNVNAGLAESQRNSAIGTTAGFELEI